MTLDGLVSYRIERADEALAEAAVLIDSQHYNTAVNRCYYACYYIASAYMARNGLTARSHKGQLMVFDQQLVKPGTVPIDTAEVYRSLFGERHEADYADLVRICEDEARAWLERARRFVSEIRELL